MTIFFKKYIISANDKKVEKEQYDAMRYLKPALKAEYDYLSQKYEDIEELAHPYINLSDVFRAYFILADYFTDESSNSEVESMFVGLRSIDLLISALCRQNTTFGGHSKYTSNIDICSTLFYGMVKNHSFCDGNKRTALLILLYQLYLYNYLPQARANEFEKLVVAIARNSLDSDFGFAYKKFKKSSSPEIDTISYLLRQMVAKKDHTYHVNATMREFCNALEQCGVKCEMAKSKMHFTYIERKFWLFPAKEKNYTSPFGGWTRTVGPETARNILQNLGLYGQYPSYESLLSGGEPMYAFISQFEVPFRRLKDE